MRRLRGVEHRRLVATGTGLLIAATLVAVALPVVVSALFRTERIAVASGPSLPDHRPFARR
jgi:hypothetical protein